jgi:hypothetical protein
MGMGIDEPGQNDLARNIKNLPGAGRQNVGLNRGDLAAANGDIFHAIDARRGIDDATSAQKQIKGCAYRHGRSPLLIAGGHARQPIAKYTSYFNVANFVP